jgi:choline-sulfatase
MMVQYYAKITLIDEMVGEIVAALRDTGRLENTWIVYSADHGEMLGDHEIWGKVVMYEGSIRIPLIIRPPGGVAPWVAGGMTDQKDITASILEMAGLDPGDLPGASLVTRVLAPSDDPGAQLGKERVFSEIIGDPVNNRFQVVMLRDARYKVQFDTQMSDPVEFYDLQEDPEEMNNRVLDPDYADVIAERVALIETLIAEEVPAETA